MHHSSVTGYSIGSAFVDILCLAGLREIPLQIHTVGVGYRSVGPFRHSVRFCEGDAPIQEKLEAGAHRMSAGFHDDEAPLGNGLQFVRCQQCSLHHLQALAGVILAPVYGAGQHGAATQRFG